MSYIHLPTTNTDTPSTPVVFEKNGEVLASSRDVAEYFGKKHHHFLRDVREKIRPKLDTSDFNSMFSFKNYPDKYGRAQSEEHMTKDGFTLLVMGYTGAKAMEFMLAYTKRFNEMEAVLKEAQPESFDTHLPTTFAEALRMAANQQHDRQL